MRQQLVLPPLGNDPSALQHHDVVRVFDGEQPVGDDQQRLALCHRRDADHRQHDMAGALRDHMRQRRLQVLDLIHHYGLDLADAAVLHIAQRRTEKAIRQTQAQSLQNGIRHAVGRAGGQAEQQDLDPIGQQRQQAPLYHCRACGSPRRKQTDDHIQ